MKDSKYKVEIALKKSHSLIVRVMEMFESDRYCIDIIQQNLAIIGILKAANLNLLKGHLDSCVREAIESNNKENLNKMMEEIFKIMKIAQNK